jgi:DNA-binding CsgD family transcriptional regulator
MNLRAALRRTGLSASMLRPALAGGAVLAVGAAALGWVNMQHSVRLVPTELYVIVIAVFFTVLGIWAGQALTARRVPPAAFARNDAALRSLGITAREYEVLERIAAGRTNKEIARALGVSPNTVKTQAASLFGKLDAARRIDAVGKARALSLIP